MNRNKIILELQTNAADTCALQLNWNPDEREPSVHFRPNLVKKVQGRP